MQSRRAFVGVVLLGGLAAPLSTAAQGRANEPAPPADPDPDPGAPRPRVRFGDGGTLVGLLLPRQDGAAARAAQALLAAAREQKIAVLVLHTGGEGRRGKTSNDLIDIVVPQADQVIVVASGNKDKVFNTLAAKRNAPVVEVEKLAGVGAAVKTAFGM